MSKKRYERIDAEGLLAPLKSSSTSILGMLLESGVKLDIREAGIWPGEAYVWRPSMDKPASERGARLIDTPALPFPFDAADLAAFMLDGLGAWVREYYETDGALDEEQLSHIRLEYDYSRNAIREAFGLLNEAIEAIGPGPDSNSSEWPEWRKAMVQHLLLKARPAEEGPVTEAVAPAPAGADGAIETPHQRQDRRLAAIRAAGGDHNGKRMTGERGVLAKLVRSEKAAGRPMSDEKDFREDLKAAVGREVGALRAGAKGRSVFDQ